MTENLDRLLWPVAAEVDEPDPVNRPSHYTRFPVEVIDITEHLSFNLGNVVKYVARAGHKEGSDELTDLRKGLWYLQREIARLEGVGR